MRDKVFLDTNILVYLSNPDSSFHAGICRTCARLKDRAEFWISRQVLREYGVIVSRSDFMEKPLNAAEVVAFMNKWESICTVADETRETTAALKSLIAAYGIRGKKIHDANIVATMHVHGVSKLLTANLDDFRSFRDIKLVHVRSPI